ncbi:family 16 glycosylhydrolase [Streptomyces sp. NBRC 109706]|uniref:glycoside hydrolase family 16 protein n=1 Tax=Streptomyces sp. NBRC 109706 TaxID=1550035 RepID=UPI000782F743|nr:glycoside hydrolase family 16 protein [Streptomyces sp. NBRC 109706]
MKSRARLVGWLLALTVVGAGVVALSDGAGESGGGRSGGDATVAPGPDADLDGWDLVFTDDFDRDQLGDGWSPYSGQPGGDPYSWWDPSHVETRDGNLVLAGYQEEGRWVTGGVSHWPVTRTYGRWEVRFRADPSDEITYHFLLWPEREAWPPEIDFIEDFGGPRRGGSAFVHYVDERGERGQIERSLADVDFTDWRTVAVEWTPGEIAFLVDGEVWSTVEGDEVPDEPMWLALQSQAGGCERSAEWGFPRCPQAGVPERADVEIDWVAVWAPAP